MKRDMDLVRRLLLRCETSEYRSFHVGTLDYCGHDSDETFVRTELSETELFHIDLMAEAGLIQQIRREHPVELAEDVFEITWIGYEYLDAVRDEEIWNETKTAIADVGASAAIDIVRTLAIGFAKTKISKHTGIDL